MKQIKIITTTLLSLVLSIFFLHLTVLSLKLTHSTYVSVTNKEVYDFSFQFIFLALICFVISLLIFTIAAVGIKVFIKTYNDNIKKDRDIYIKDRLDSIAYQNIINVVNSVASLEDKEAKVKDFYTSRGSVTTKEAINDLLSDLLVEKLSKRKEYEHNKKLFAFEDEIESLNNDNPKSMAKCELTEDEKTAMNIEVEWDVIDSMRGENIPNQDLTDKEWEEKHKIN
jgi:hypothetical protein